MAHARTLSLTEGRHAELLGMRDRGPRPDVREKAAALLKIAEGKAPYRVARNGLLKRRDPDTVYGWLNCYEARGAQGLYEKRHGGPRRGRL
ncbi:MAG: helix-turn-helix domain-containing protein [Rubrobacter sp.]